MGKTGSQVETDIYRIIKASNLASSISGKIYKNGFRPLDSDKEDIIISFLTGLDDQVQKGVVNINIYVPDIVIVQKIKNSAKCKELEAIAYETTTNITDVDYDFELDKMIQTFKVQNNDQHFINIRLKFRIIK